MRNYEGISLDRTLTDLVLILVDKRGYGKCGWREPALITLFSTVE